MQNDLERLENALTAVVFRVTQLESRQPECCQAQAVACEIGLDPGIVCRMSPQDHEERTALIVELRRRNWSVGAIARALRCREKTVERATGQCP